MVSSVAVVQAANAEAKEFHSRSSDASRGADVDAIRVNAALALLLADRGVSHRTIRAAGTDYRPAAVGGGTVDRGSVELALD
ncbi:hypothetical protein D3C87_1604330 [compost metagenome]